MQYWYLYNKITVCSEFTHMVYVTMHLYKYIVCEPYKSRCVSIWKNTQQVYFNNNNNYNITSNSPVLILNRFNEM